MRLISFDIGIKNLAYCIFETSENAKYASAEDFTPHEKTLTVIDWNVLNLLNNNGETSPLHNHTCNCVLEKSKKGLSALCGNKAKYEKGNNYYCEKHAKSNKSFLIPKKEYSPHSLKKLKLNALHSHYMYLYPFASPSSSTSKKKQELIDEITKYYEEKCFHVVGGSEGARGKKVTASSVDLIQIGRAIQSQLDSVLDVNAITHVIIENQISTIATRMKTIQGMLTQYFISKPNSSEMIIEYISSSNKLKGLVDKTTKDPKPTHDQKAINVYSGGLKSSEGAYVAFSEKRCTGASFDGKAINPDYKKHKKDGIHFCGEFLASNPTLGDWHSKFTSKTSPSSSNVFQTKKDDLADCFLQGIWYLKTNKIITYAENLKINSM
jgi:hypothetical protein